MYAFDNLNAAEPLYLLLAKQTTYDKCALNKSVPVELTELQLVQVIGKNSRKPLPLLPLGQKPIKPSVASPKGWF